MAQAGGGVGGQQESPFPQSQLVAVVQQQTSSLLRRMKRLTSAQPRCPPQEECHTAWRHATTHTRFLSNNHKKYPQCHASVVYQYRRISEVLVLFMCIDFECYLNTSVAISISMAASVSKVRRSCSDLGRVRQFKSFRIRPENCAVKTQLQNISNQGSSKVQSSAICVYIQRVKLVKLCRESLSEWVLCCTVLIQTQTLLEESAGDERYLASV